MTMNRRGRMSKLGSLAMLSVLGGFFVVAVGSQPAGKVAPAKPMAPEPIPGRPAQQGNLTTLSVWVEAARQTFKRVQDYQCTFTKRERIDGVLQDEQTAEMKVRTQPFSVHLKFNSPRAVAGKEASYVQGRLNGKMRAKNGGALRLVGYVTIEPTDNRAMQGTRHAITEAGLGNLIEQIARSIVPVAGKPEPQITVAEYNVDQRPGVRFEIVDPAADGKTSYHRTIIYFDKATNFPIRYECYNARHEMIECFAYTELRFNVGLTDAAFP